MEKKTTISSLQDAVLIGSLLGDGHIQKTSAGTEKCRLRFCHSKKQSDYLDWKYKVFSDFCTRTKPPYFTNRNEYLFYTSYETAFVSYHDTWYVQKNEFPKRYRKRVPETLDSLLVDPIALAVWYLDDGTKRNYNASRLATQCFSLEENKKLQVVLEQNFGLLVKVERWLQKGTVQYNLSIPSRTGSFSRLKDLIYPFVKAEIPSMLYKVE